MKKMNKTLAIEMLKDIKKGIMPCDMTDICDYRRQTSRWQDRSL